MTRQEKCELAIKKGYTYNPETGVVSNRFGKELKSKSNDGYLFIMLIKDKKSYFFPQHQFAWYYVNKETVVCLDHINKDKTDNRIVNLRSVTKQQNSFNSNARGYYWNKNSKKWHSQIRLNERIHLGFYDTEEEARQVYLQAKEKYHVIN